jgi:hypothetical protein
VKEYIAKKIETEYYNLIAGSLAEREKEKFE